MTTDNPEVRALREEVNALTRRVKGLEELLAQYGQNGLNHARFENLDTRYAASAHTH